LIGRIVDAAQSNFANHCSKANPISARWADNYCTKLKDVIHLQDGTLAEDKKSEIISRVIYNPELFVPEQPSSFIGYSNKLRTLRETSVGGRDDSVYKWIGIVMLPIGIALRVMKTSFELLKT
jgi:hypothetical protein